MYPTYKATLTKRLHGSLCSKTERTALGSKFPLPPTKTVFMYSCLMHIVNITSSAL